MRQNEVLARANNLASAGRANAAIELLEGYLMQNSLSQPVLESLSKLYLATHQPEMAAYYSQRSIEIGRRSMSACQSATPYEFDAFTDDDMDFLDVEGATGQVADFSFDDETAHSDLSATSTPDITSHADWQPSRACVDSLDAESSIQPAANNASWESAPEVATESEEEERLVVQADEEGHAPRDETSGPAHTSSAPDDNGLASSSTSSPVASSEPTELDSITSIEQDLVPIEDESVLDEEDEQDDLDDLDQLLEVESQDPFEDLDDLEDYDELEEVEDLEAFDESARITSDAAIQKRLTREQRATQIAVEFLEETGWQADTLDLLSTIFFENGWSATRRALRDAVERGLTPEELDVAREIRLFWKASEQYWVTFLYIKPGKLVNEARDIHQYMSWRDAIRIIRSFSGTPTLEEVEDYIEESYDQWYSSPRLRRRYEAFYRYLRFRTELRRRREWSLYFAAETTAVDWRLEPHELYPGATPVNRILDDLGVAPIGWPKPPVTKMRCTFKRDDAGQSLNASRRSSGRRRSRRVAHESR